MPGQRVQAFLDEKDIKYVVINHSPAYTALEISEAAHIPGKMMAKSLMIYKDDTLVMVVMPANYKLSLEAFKEASGAKQARFATEQEFINQFPDCDIGAMPPFGNLYQMEVYADEHLTQHDEIVFNAGSHYQLFKMRIQDFLDCVQPTLIHTSI